MLPSIESARQRQRWPHGGDPRLATLSGLYCRLTSYSPQAGVARLLAVGPVLRSPDAPKSYPPSATAFWPLQDAQGPAGRGTHPQLPKTMPHCCACGAGDKARWLSPAALHPHAAHRPGPLALGLALAVAVHCNWLRPLQLRARLAAARSGAGQPEGSFQELQPLVQEFNHVLAENADMVRRARTQAGNLAHAVHTPLSILANAAAQEQGTLGALVREQVASARRQVDYHLARARAAAAVRATGLATPVLAPARALLRTMEHLHAARALSFELAPQAQDLAFRGEEQDLYELLGNLVDNAGKWARTRVVVDVQPHADQLCITVDDDGPGIPEEQRECSSACSWTSSGRPARLTSKRAGRDLRRQRRRWPAPGRCTPVLTAAAVEA